MTGMYIEKEDYEKLLHQRNELLEMVHEKAKIIDELFEIIKKKDTTIDEYQEMVVAYRIMVDKQKVAHESIWAQFIANVGWGGFAEMFRNSKNYARYKLREKTQYLITHDRYITHDKRGV